MPQIQSGLIHSCYLAMFQDGDSVDANHNLLASTIGRGMTAERLRLLEQREHHARASEGASRHVDGSLFVAIIPIYAVFLAWVACTAHGVVARNSCRPEMTLGKMLLTSF